MQVKLDVLCTSHQKPGSWKHLLCDVCEVQKTADQMFAKRTLQKRKHSWMHSENGEQQESTFACLMLMAILQ
jgi:hypothetical protein